MTDWNGHDDYIAGRADHARRRGHLRDADSMIGGADVSAADDNGRMNDARS